jgi:hypothetical protein
MSKTIKHEIPLRVLKRILESDPARVYNSIEQLRYKYMHFDPHWGVFYSRSIGEMEIEMSGGNWDWLQHSCKKLSLDPRKCHLHSVRAAVMDVIANCVRKAQEEGRLPEKRSGEWICLQAALADKMTEGLFASICTVEFTLFDSAETLFPVIEASASPATADIPRLSGAKLVELFGA